MFVNNCLFGPDAISISNERKDWKSYCNCVYWNFRENVENINFRIYNIRRGSDRLVKGHNLWIELLGYLYYNSYWNLKEIKSTLLWRVFKLLKDFLNTMYIIQLLVNVIWDVRKMRKIKKRFVKQRSTSEEASCPRWWLYSAHWERSLHSLIV